MAGLRLEHIYKVYPNGTKAVSDFTMDIQDQEFIVFVGPSGCGKSTTLRMIAGLEEISAGELYIDDRIVNDVEPKDRDIAMVFQNYALYPHMTVYENMAFGLKLRHVPNEVIHEKVLWAAKILNLTELLDRKPRAMSGGQRQRVALGRALLRNPKVMLLDEPLSNLDAKLRAAMRSEIAKLHEELKTTFIYVTHDQVEAMTLGTRVVVMKLGRIMQMDTPKNLYDYPDNLFVAGFIGTPQMNFFDATLSRNKEVISVNFAGTNSVVEVPRSILRKVQPQYYDGVTPVIVGLRGEHISLDPEKVANSKTLVDVKISHFEELGNETYIYGDLNMEGSGFEDSKTRVIIKGACNYGLSKGQITKAAFDFTRVHMFDKKTENSINPRIPSTNLVDATIMGGKLSFASLSFELPKAIQLPDGACEVTIPTRASTLSNTVGQPVRILGVEHVGDVRLISIEIGENILFTSIQEDFDQTKEWRLQLDFTQLTFVRNGEVVKSSINEYDRINAIFLNNETAKSYVGDKYQPVIEQRVQAVVDKYEPMLAELEANYKRACEVESSLVTPERNKHNSDILAQKKAEVKEKLNVLNQELKTKLAEYKKYHIENNLIITEEVTSIYNKIRDDEYKAFEAFKTINKDRDAFRKRNQELQSFKATFTIEKNNELEKRINLEAVRYESEVNAAKGHFKREKEFLTKELEVLENKCKYESNPIKDLTKNYKEQRKKIEV
jgi:multiple sugar transport system ATP-binding protein